MQRADRYASTRTHVARLAATHRVILWVACPIARVDTFAPTLQAALVPAAMAWRALTAVSIAARVVVRGAKSAAARCIPDRGIATLAKHERAASAVIQTGDGVRAPNLRREAIAATADAAHSLAGAFHVVVGLNATAAVSGKTAVAHAAVTVTMPTGARQAAPVVCTTERVTAVGHARVALACISCSCVRSGATARDTQSAGAVDLVFRVGHELEFQTCRCVAFNDEAPSKGGLVLFEGVESSHWRSVSAWAEADVGQARRGVGKADDELGTDECDSFDVKAVITRKWRRHVRQSGDVVQVRVFGARVRGTTV